jgi:hypothetical protein
MFMRQVMIEAALWVVIDAEARAWRSAGHTPRLWWRDDDTRAPSDSLSRLLALAERRHAPLALAVIPDADLAGLAVVLQARSSVTIIQHGCDHVDRNKNGQVSSEFAPDASPADIAATIVASWARISTLPRTIPVYAPPWNVLMSNAREALRQTPLRAVSVYGAPKMAKNDLPEINSHIDIMKWRPARFRGGQAVLFRLWRQLRARRLGQRWNEPIGLLTHHKDLDPDAWNFLDRLLTQLDSRTNAFEWRSIGKLLQDADG